jgi:uncharacterized protein
MRLLFDLGHPAHIHLFRNLIKRTRQEEGEVLVATREKDVTVELCRAYEIPQIILSRANRGQILTGGWELLSRTFKLFRVARMFKPDALIGTSLSIGIVGRITCCPSFVFNEDDAGVVPLFAKVAYPACSYIVTPECLKHENYGKKHLIYPGYHELAYLHPDHFTPDISVPRSIGLGPDKPYFILRLVALRAHHDTAAKGMPFDIAKKLVQILSESGRVLITSEDELQDQFKEYQFPLAPDKLHDVLAFASMYIGESQTMAAEAAVLGVPSLRCNTFVGRISYLEELEKKFGLTVGFLPEESDKLLTTVNEWLANLEDIRKEMRSKRNKMLTDKIDLADWQWHMLCEKLQNI